MNGPMPDRAALAQRVAQATLAVPGVTGLMPGPGVEVATQYPGGKVVGVRLTDDAVSVHIRIDRLPVAAVTGAVAAAVAAVLAAAGDHRQVEIVLEELDDVALHRASAKGEGGS